MKILYTIGIVLIAALTSCSMDPVYVEEDFGHSVRQMVAGQISDPEAAANPSPDAPPLLDGVSAEESLIYYRKGAAKSGNGAASSIHLSID